MKYHNTLFIVTEERSCPIYNVGEEFKVEEMALTVPEGKPACLMMVRELMKAVTEKRSMEQCFPSGLKKVTFACDGCTGQIRFDFKKGKDFFTLQMRMLAMAEQKAKTNHLDRFYDELRQFDIFELLNETSLRDFSGQLQLKEFGPNEIVLKKGVPGTNLYIMLEGRVAMIDDGGQILSEMGAGDIFGEMCLLSAEPITAAIHSREKTRLVTLSSKDFKHVLNRSPVLQVFFYRMLVERAQGVTMRASAISSGITGQLSEINPVELFQLINSSQKTGKVQLTLDNGEAVVAFHDGELIDTHYRHLSGKEAFFALLAKSDGSFAFTSGLSAEEKKLPMIDGFMGLIMEGMRRLDEQAL